MKIPTRHSRPVVASGIGSALAGSSLGAEVAAGLQGALALGFQSAQPAPIEQLAQALHLPVNGLTLSAPPGQRVLFGAQKHIASYDHPGRFGHHFHRTRI